MLKIASAADWRGFESDRWREAVRDRGLRLHSLDSDERELVLSAITADLDRRRVEGPLERQPAGSVPHSS